MIDSKIAEAIEPYFNSDFDWENNNCALTSATVFENVFEVDISSKYRSKCTSVHSAVRILKEEGGLENILSKNNFTEFPTSMANRGDLVIYEYESDSSGRSKRSALGIAIDYRAAFKSGKGIIFISLNNCKSSWRLIK